MSKAFLFVIGIALIVISANYFVSVGLLTVTPNASSNTEKLSTPSSQMASPEPTRPDVTPLAANPSDRLRSALESVVEESIEQALWDEMESQATATKEKIQ